MNKILDINHNELTSNQISNYKNFLTDITIKIKKNDNTSAILPVISNS